MTMSNPFGFGGSNSCVVLPASRLVDRPVAAAWA